ncbi:hypothetical protein [Kutzneria sp. NPDC051319]|uniref:hypothetical protein n=1 Tax=Kutzneria sp. NPDC051319 TaxID=3155047 RepID=UPI0034425EAE
MTHTSPPDLASLAHTMPDGVVRAAELRASGVSGSAIVGRCRPGGPWQRLLPGVVLMSSAEPSRRQRLRAALAYAGEDAAITGLDAAGLDHDLGVRAQGDVHVLIPASRRTTTNGYVFVERTTRMPTLIERDGLRYAPMPRAVVDAARREHDAVRLRALLSGPVRFGACSASALRVELDSGNQRGSAAPRAALRSVSDGVVSLTEALARRVARGAALPMPRWNVPLRDVAGSLLGVVDAWWDDVALAWEVGTHHFRLGHTDPSPGYASPALTSAGVIIVRTPASRLRSDPTGVRRDLVQAFHRAADRVRPPVHALSDRAPTR